MQLGFFNMPLHPPGSDLAQPLADDLAPLDAKSDIVDGGDGAVGSRHGVDADHWTHSGSGIFKLVKSRISILYASLIPVGRTTSDRGRTQRAAMAVPRTP